MRERERLITRIRQIRRASPPPATPPPDTPPDGDSVAIQALRTRVEHLEQLLEALQDSVHRESERQSRRLSDVEAQLQPAALGRALSRDARERGL